MKPAPTELVILKHLWANGRQSIREIHDGASTQLDWSYSSTRKTVERMIAKGMVSVSEYHGLKTYKAKSKKVPTIAAIVREFATDVLGLEGPMPVANLVRSQTLSPEELEELDKLLRTSADDEPGDDS